LTPLELMMTAAPKWFPYRLRKTWDHALVVRTLRRLHESAPIPASSPGEALAEIHMLLCRRDVEIGVLALKSLLRFRRSPWAVTITVDGSVTDAQRAWVDHHIPGCQWLPRTSTDPRMANALQTRPRLAALYRSDYSPLRKLLHPVVLARQTRVLVLDPDAAFWQPPNQLVAWAAAPDGPSLFLHDHQDESVQVPPEVREAFIELHHLVAPEGKPWSMPYFFFNSGLLAYCPDLCDLDLAEKYLQWLETAPARYTTGKPGLWFGTWTPEQTAYQLIFAGMDPEAQPLGDDYRIGHRRGGTFNHFLWLQLVMPPSLNMLRSLVDSLPRD
jgi:hypothetical protein